MSFVHSETCPSIDMSSTWFSALESCLILSFHCYPLGGIRWKLTEMSRLLMLLCLLHKMSLSIARSWASLLFTFSSVLQVETRPRPQALVLSLLSELLLVQE